MEDWKIKIAVLWIVVECGVIAVSVGEQWIPGHSEEIIAQTTPELMLMLAIVVMIPPLMAFLSLTLSDSINRWANIILGVVFAVLTPIGVIGFPAAYIASAILISIVQVVASILVIWFAWKSRKKA